MKVDAIRLDLRPRGMLEAADLGVRVVSAHARSVWSSCLPVYAFVLAVAAATYPFGEGWPFLVLFLLKPWFDRSILFVVARAVFGEETRFADLWAARRVVLGTELLGALTVRRLSPWRSYVQPVLQLEGQHGKARRERVARILGPHRAAALGLQSAFATAEFAIGFGLAMLATWFAPDEQMRWIGAWTGESGGWLAPLYMVTFATATLIVEPFFVGAGFAMYLNRRVELEAWDIEQEFRIAFAR